MLKSILKFIGWVPKEERNGAEIDFNNAWEFESISKKNEFLSWLIQYVPNNSIWSIEGLYNKELFRIIRHYLTDDGLQVQRGTVWPRPKYCKVLLNEESKNTILKNINKWNLDVDIIHQHIYYQKDIYLTSYDNLTCVWLTKIIDQSELDKLEEEGIIVYEKDTEHVGRL